jgi:peptidoglycan-N-acetylglucosamine deacetylase
VRTRYLVGAALAAGTVATHAGPALTAVPALRQRMARGLAGVGDPRHVTLTLDDGPHSRSAPAFLRRLDAHRIRATFFVLGGMLARHQDTGREILAAGHELALHGYEHRRLAWRGPRDSYDDLARGCAVMVDMLGAPPPWRRPPNGVLTCGALSAARRLGLTPVLWTARGRAWTARATAASVYRTVSKDLTGGGTVLLHDSDVTSAPGSWRATLGALPRLLERCHRRDVTAGPLGEHGIAS